MYNNFQAFLQLLQLGIRPSSILKEPISSDIEWIDLKDLAELQGVSAVVLDGIEKLPKQQRPPKAFLLEWIGEMLQGYEYRYNMYCKAIAELAKFYSTYGYKMMVLKGYACSLNWPKPEHRPCGDIDIWLFGKQKEADDLVVKNKGVKIDYGHNVHSVFNWGDFIVENHYEFFDLRRFRTLSNLGNLLEEMADDTNCIKIQGEKVYVPSVNLHALFLIIHALNHFASIGINLRQVLDWAFFVEKHTKVMDWDWLNKMLDEYHMKEFVDSINAICVEDLGFDSVLFHGVQFNPAVKDKMFREILTPEYGNNLPQGFIPRVLFKLRRWQGSAWKQELCYHESRWRSFTNGLWWHLMKPETI